jgi:hypothetical protein
MRSLRFTSLLFLSCAACSNASERTGPGDAGRDATKPIEAAAPDVSSQEASSESDSGGCTGPGLAKRWVSMDHAVITATSAANLDLDPDGGLTLEKAQAVLCEGTELASLADGGHVQAWGAESEVQLVFDPGTGDGEGLSLFEGYLGSFDFQSDPSAGPVHHYTLGIDQIEEDGAPVEIEWAVTPFTVGTDVFNALMYTYGTPLGVYSGPLTTSCQTVSVCPVNTSSGQAIWNIVPLGITFTFNSVDVQPAASTAMEIDLSVP